jgi:hypothetical protein
LQVFHSSLQFSPLCLFVTQWEIERKPAGWAFLSGFRKRSARDCYSTLALNSWREGVLRQDGFQDSIVSNRFCDWEHLDRQAGDSIWQCHLNRNQISPQNRDGILDISRCIPFPDRKVSSSMFNDICKSMVTNASKSSRGLFPDPKRQFIGHADDQGSPTRLMTIAENSECAIICVIYDIESLMLKTQAVTGCRHEHRNFFRGRYDSPPKLRGNRSWKQSAILGSGPDSFPIYSPRFWSKAQSAGSDCHACMFLWGYTQA